MSSLHEKATARSKLTRSVGRSIARDLYGGPLEEQEENSSAVFTMQSKIIAMPDICVHQIADTAVAFAHAPCRSHGQPLASLNV